MTPYSQFGNNALSMRRSTLIIPLLVAVLIGLAAHAEAIPPKEGELILTRFYKKPISSFEKFKFGGSIKFTNYSYPYAVPNTDIRTSNRLIFKFDLDARVDEHVRIFGNMKVRTDLPQSTVRTAVIPLEAFLDVNVDRFNIRAGYQIFSWGVADIYNPTDMLNPRDYSDIFDFEKDGMPALKFTFAGDKISFDGVWMPVPLESELPYEDSRFVQPFLSAANNPLFPVIGIPPANVDLTLNELTPPLSIKSSQFAARVLATVGRFDLGLSYFNGFEKVPSPEVIIGWPNPLTGKIPATVNEVYIREQIIGFSAVTGYKGLNMKGEAALVIPYKSTHDVGAADDLNFVYVVGADYTFFDLFDKDDLTITLEYVQQINSTKPNWEDFADPFQNTIFGRIVYRFSERFNIELLGIYNFDNNGYYVQPEITWKPIEDLVFTFGGSILGGPSDTLFGLFDKQDRVYVSSAFYF